MAEAYQICSRCILDTTVPGIYFDERGVCNFCKLHDVLEKKYPMGTTGEVIINKTIKEIKKNGKNKRYDCIVGVSGGTDSTYTLFLAKKWGLRPLAVHFDNGWDSEIAVTNIKNATSKLDVDLFTYVMDWEEFKELQIAFLKASTPDAEIPTDIGIIGALYRLASKEKIHYAINGHSFRTEGTSPIFWTYMDGKYIENIYKEFNNNKKLKYFPNLKLSDLFYYSFLKGIKDFRPLEYLHYDKVEAGEILKKELGWRYYGGHHHECLYTKFHHSYLLIKKFNIDYRRVSTSARIRSDLISRDDGLKFILENPYKPEKENVTYVLNKLGLSEKEFDDIMKLPKKTFLDYPTYYPLMRTMRFPIKVATKMGLVPEILYLKYSGFDYTKENISKSG